MRFTAKHIDKTIMAEDADIYTEACEVKRTESVVDDNFLVVAAIDFGTTFSGYAFSFRDEF